MSFRKQDLMPLGIFFAVALGAAVFLTSSAHANWLVLDEGVKEPDVTLKFSAHTELVLLVKEETNLEILCSTVESDSTAAFLLLEKSTVAHGHILVKICKTWQGGKDVTAKCKPVEPIKIGGLAELVLHNGDNYILIKPLTASKLGQVKFKEPCALPETNNLSGELIVECGHLNGSGQFSHLDCKNHQVTQLLKETEASLLFPHELRYGTKVALLDGIVAASIGGPGLYVGTAWGGHI